MSLMQEYLIQCLHYEPETGIFTWKRRPREHFLAEYLWRRWNTKYSGKIAGTNQKTGYRTITLNQRLYYSHRMAWLFVHGEWPFQIDHINGVRHDNRLWNIRDVSNGVNCRNCGARSDNTSGRVGVYRDGDKWRACIGFEGRYIELIGRTDYETAVLYRKEAEAKYGFSERHGT